VSQNPFALRPVRPRDGDANQPGARRPHSSPVPRRSASNRPAVQPSTTTRTGVQHPRHSGIRSGAMSRARRHVVECKLTEEVRMWTAGSGTTAAKSDAPYTGQLASQSIHRSGDLRFDALRSATGWALRSSGPRWVHPRLSPVVQASTDSSRSHGFDGFPDSFGAVTRVLDEPGPSLGRVSTHDRVHRHKSPPGRGRRWSLWVTVTAAQRPQQRQDANGRSTIAAIETTQRLADAHTVGPPSFSSTPRADRCAQTGYRHYASLTSG
jgi:hypothetical protein